MGILRTAMKNYLERKKREEQGELNPPNGSVISLSGELPMSRDDYEQLKASGMMWEIYPEFTGNYEVDIHSHNARGQVPEE
jgi:hypothetical protein